MASSSMIRGAVLAILAALFWAPLSGAAHAQPPATPQAELRIGYVELGADPRYAEDRAYAGIRLNVKGNGF